MSIDEERYFSKSLYREENIYYDLGYRYTYDTTSIKPINADYTITLLVYTFIMQTLLGIPLIFTLGGIILYIFIRYVKDNENSAIAILLVLGAHIFDYYNNEFQTTPSGLFSSQLTLIFWIFEIIWNIIFILQLMVIFQATTPLNQQGKTVIPETEQAKLNYDKMIKRMRNTKFEIKETHQIINVETIQINFISVLKISGVIMLSIVLLDVIFWKIYNFISQGRRIDEEYLISGLVLLLLMSIIVFSKNIFPSDEEINEENKMNQLITE